MVSMFEDMLLRYSNGKARLREHLLQHLDDDSLRNMRLVSRVLHDLMDRYPSRMFGRLFIRISWAHDTDTSSLTAAAPFCRSLTIKLGPGEVHMGQRVRRLLQRRDVLQAISSHISLPPSAEIPGGRDLSLHDPLHLQSQRLATSLECQQDIYGSIFFQTVSGFEALR
jgi:hypothetical protein